MAGKTPLELLLPKLDQPGLTDAQREEMKEVRRVRPTGLGMNDACDFNG